jgi:hypothetical protein
MKGLLLQGGQMNQEMAMVVRRNEEREALRGVIQQWNANRLDLFELSEPNEVSLNLLLIPAQKQIKRLLRDKAEKSARIWTVQAHANVFCYRVPKLLYYLMSLGISPPDVSEALRLLLTAISPNTSWILIPAEAFALI